jgi:hypothetical protein
MSFADLNKSKMCLILYFIGFSLLLIFIHPNIILRIIFNMRLFLDHANNVNEKAADEKREKPFGQKRCNGKIR